MVVKTKTKEYPINWMGIGSIDPLLRISIKSKDVLDIASTFLDAGETETLTNVFDDGKEVPYYGYITVTGINVMNDGTVVALKKVEE